MPENYTEFAAIHESLTALAKRHSESPSGRWGEDERGRITALVRSTFVLLDRLSRQGSLRAATHVREIEELTRTHLGHKTVLFEVVGEGADGPGNSGGAASLDEFLHALQFILRGLAVEFPDPIVREPEPGSPRVEKQYIARRLGRTRKGLESYVSKWRQRFGKDPPWVTRHMGTPWLPDVEAFEEWRRTSEGEKATVRRRRGRPPRT